MRSSVTRIFFLIVLIGAMNVEARSYVVRKGDTLASIARSFYGEPVFGPQGTINKIYRLNPWAKAAGSALEPGQEIFLEEKNERKKVVKAEAAAVPPPLVPGGEPLVAHEPPPPPPPIAKEESEAPPAHEPPPAPPQNHEKVPPPPFVEHHQEMRAEPKQCAPSREEGRHEEHEIPRNYFSIIPSYSIIHQKATDAASGLGYAMNATSFGGEIGWDHWWNESFSTLLTYSLVDMSSKATSDLTGGKILPSTTLTTLELALLDRVGHRVRLGLGAAYGDHLFLENVSSVPSDPSIYKTAFWNPFFAAEITAYESESFEWLINLKLGALPAQVGQGHDLNRGTEFAAQISLLEKFETWALTYGLSYSSEDQTRTDANETRSEAFVKIGVLF